jgi:hypothetical protein
VPARAGRAGNDLIAEHFIEFRAWREDLARLLADVDVFLIGVHGDLAETGRRERGRGDRRPGEGRAHVQTGLIHAFGPNGFDVDTTHRGIQRADRIRAGRMANPGLPASPAAQSIRCVRNAIRPSVARPHPARQTDDSAGDRLTASATVAGTFRARWSN